MRIPLVLLVLFLSSTVFAAEGIFDDTYYLNRDRGTVTWVLVLTRDRLFEIYGPEGQFTAGTYKFSDDHLALIVGNSRRVFNWDKEERHDLKLGYRDNTKVEKGSVLAKLPPIKESSDRELYIHEREWVGKGRPALVKRIPAGAPVQPGGAPVAIPGGVPAPAQGNDIAGSYYLPGPNNKREQFSLSPDGHYEYIGLDGASSQGTFNLVGDELILSGAALRRSFTVHKIPGGIELIRKDSDVIKPGDTLGRMPPQERDPFTWFKVSDAEPSRAPQAVPAEAAAGISALNQLKSVVPPAQPNTAPAPAPVASGPVTFNALLGSYVHKPNPFISETITVGADGTFRYKDSNGASASGVFSLVDDTLTITSGEVVRRFRVTQDGKSLTLNCSVNDAPKFKNDLASMSPTVLKVAKYEKQ